MDLTDEQKAIALKAFRLGRLLADDRDDNYTLFLWTGGPFDGGEYYLPKDADCWACPTLGFWYPYYRNENDVFVWDGRELTLEEAKEEMK